MFTLEQIAPHNASLFKTVRLQALKDSPLAFGSTYANESKLSDADWLKRATDWSSPRSVGYLAFARHEACGICGGFLDQDNPRVAHIVSMWVGPDWRGKGLGQKLLAAMRVWGKKHGAESIQLTVTNSNAVAIRFYEQNGYAKTGETEPYPNDPALFEYVMSTVVADWIEPKEYLSSKNT